MSVRSCEDYFICRPCCEELWALGHEVTVVSAQTDDISTKAFKGSVFKEYSHKRISLKIDRSG